MTISPVKRIGSWLDVLDAARTTMGKMPATKEPSDQWKKKILLAEHSPIRLLTYKWTWHDIPYWVSVHLVRHKIGIEHFVKSSRTDRTGIDRNELPQDTPVNHTCVANAQALINISRKRMCAKASIETQHAWMMLREEIAKVEPLLAEAMMPDCVYRGDCYEMESCGMINGEIYNMFLESYRNMPNGK